MDLRNEVGRFSIRLFPRQWKPATCFAKSNRDDPAVSRTCEAAKTIRRQAGDSRWRNRRFGRTWHAEFSTVTKQAPSSQRQLCRGCKSSDRLFCFRLALLRWLRLDGLPGDRTKSIARKNYSPGRLR